MVEHTSVSEGRQELSIDDRLTLIQTLNALPSTQFDELVFALQPPSGNIPDKSAAQGSRSMALLKWVESPVGPGLAALEEILGKIIATHSKTSAQYMAFVISGKISSSTTAEIQAFVQLLRQKTGDDSIDVAFFREGSIKLILSGSPEGLENLQALFESGKLGDLEIPPVENVYPVDHDSPDARKARLIQALSFRKQILTKIVNLARDLDLYLAHTRDLDLYLARARARALDRASSLARDLAHDLNLTRGRGRDLYHARASDLYHALASARDLYRARALDLTRDLASDPVSASASASDLALVSSLASDLAHDLTRARADFDRAIAVDLRDINLRGANLEHLNLNGVDLRGADLTYANLVGADLTDANLANANLIDADVTDTIFGNNLGLTEADKDDLRRRGAIFQDPPTSDVPSLVQR